MTNRFLTGLVTALLVFSTATAVATERRVALVIGNNDYKSVPKLEKAVNDAQAVSRELSKIGFEVMYLPNAGQKKMNQAVNEFAQKISGGGVGIFFFAGHGLQINNQNFLVPIDMDLPRDNNDVADQAINVPLLQDKLAEARAKFTLLVLDACRDNPLPKKSGTRAIGASRGLALPAQTPSGQVVMYSAGANQQALDKLGDNDSNPNGLFTREFLPTISQPGVSATDAMKKVRSSVSQKARSVGHEQQPALYDQTDGDFFFVAAASPVPAGAQIAGSAQASPSAESRAVELTFWDSIKGSNNPEDFQDYLAKYPAGEFAQLARRRAAVQSPVQSPVATRSGDVATIAPAPLAAAPDTGGAPSMASKIEEQGRMNALAVTDLRATKRDNLLRIQAEVTNYSAGTQQLYYRFKWLDRDGFTVWDDEPWKPLIIYGNQKQVISVVAPTFKASDFRLILQSPDNKAN